MPPPSQEVPDALGDLEKFWHADDRLPLLVRIALTHAQFETIHPFLDGNGRVGRLLITLMLCWGKALSQPLLYLSLYLKQNRQTYYDLLTKVRFEGAWEEWVEFFLDGVSQTATGAVDAIRRGQDLFNSDRAKVEGAAGHATGNVLRVLEAAQRNPLLTIGGCSKQIGLTFPTVSAAVKRLMQLGILQELPGRANPRRFVYKAYLDILSEGTEPLP